jgi:hypothetical protein
VSARLAGAFRDRERERGKYVYSANAIIRELPARGRRGGGRGEEEEEEGERVFFERGRS